MKEISPQIKEILFILLIVFVTASLMLWTRNFQSPQTTTSENQTQHNWEKMNGTVMVDAEGNLYCAFPEQNISVRIDDKFFTISKNATVTGCFGWGYKT